MNTQKIISEIRFITGYPEIVIDDEKVESAIEFTQNEIRSMLHEPSFEFEDNSEDDQYYIERTVMWGTCYHLKVKTGEIGGMPISIGDVNLESAIRSRGDPNGDVLRWAEKFYENFYRIPGAPKGFGHVKTDRDDREYNLPDTTDYGE